jgi:hypothetical protein
MPHGKPPAFADLVARRYGRREVLKGALAAGAGAAALAWLPDGGRPARAAGGRFGFAEIAHGIDETHHVAPGYRADVLIR